MQSVTWCDADNDVCAEADHEEWRYIICIHQPRWCSLLPEEDDDAGVDFGCDDDNDDLGYDDNDE